MFDESRAERQRRLNRLRAVQQEIAYQQEEQAIAEAREKRARASARDAALTKELFDQQQRDMRNEKMLQLVRDHPELRELEAKLKAAHVTQARKVQIEEKRLATAEGSAEDKAFLEFLVQQAKRDEEHEVQKRVAAQETVFEQQNAQRTQMEWKASQAAAEEEIRRRERQNVDAIVAQVQERDFMETLQRVEKQRVIRDQHEEFVRIRDDRLKDERARQAEEERQIMAYTAEQNKRKESDEKLKKEKEAVKARILEDQSRRIQGENRKREELETLINEYYEEQRAAKMREDERMERERKERDRQMMIAANQQQMRIKAERKDAELAEEQEFRRKMMEKFAADDRVEELSRQKKAQAKVEHSRRVQELIDEKRRQREEDAMREAMLIEAQRQREEELKRLVALERQRLLLEHGPRLDGGFLPKGLTEEDMEILRNVFSKKN
ncbi:Hypothetical protein, putative [Bodo saltans]|uniref:Meiosis-specific nuclear structural protein 1 n=1 Tax=Bodo saltans TaxID=75058 RepID=A0A0S4JLP4_BODSA|nr:Hypothetical protein, putative [Bodo saltans]|eukprot:CUG91107.1 Hypothetical protein, putative [Bodo saltans]